MSFSHTLPWLNPLYIPWKFSLRWSLWFSKITTITWRDSLGTLLACKNTLKNLVWWNFNRWSREDSQCEFACQCNDSWIGKQPMPLSKEQAGLFLYLCLWMVLAFTLSWPRMGLVSWTQNSLYFYHLHEVLTYGTTKSCTAMKQSGSKSRKCLTWMQLHD